MALDPRIAMGVQPIQIEPQANALMRALQMQGMIQQNALSKAQFEDQKAGRELQRQQMQNALLMQQQRQGYLNSLSGQAGPPEPFNVARALAAGLRLDDVKALDPEADLKPQNVGPGGAVWNPRTRTVDFQNPFKPTETAPTPLSRLMAERDALPPSHPNRRVYDAMIAKETTPAGPQTVVLGSPVPVQLPSGDTGYVQPANRPGAAPQLLTAPGSNQPFTRPKAEDEKPLTEGQAKALVYASRMQAADKVIGQLEKQGTTVAIPGAGGNSMLGDVMNAVISGPQQQLTQAQRDFINATLRRESGAVISNEEFANARRQYFPQVGDSPEVIRQKAANRRVAIEGIRADVPRGKQTEVDRISGGGGSSNDPLGIRGK